MKVKLKCSFSGVDKSWSAGDLLDCSEAEALRLIENDFAEYLPGQEVGKVIVQKIIPTLQPFIKRVVKKTDKEIGKEIKKKKK